MRDGIATQWQSIEFWQSNSLPKATSMPINMTAAGYDFSGSIDLTEPWFTGIRLALLVMFTLYILSKSIKFLKI